VNVTGRLPSKPEIQWPPLRTELAQKIRKALRKPVNRVYLNTDYAALEMRILASCTRTDRR
jgi:DNA polymerase I-like protein with 3'-5' exonuclease and polymerase domains